MGCVQLKLRSSLLATTRFKLGEERFGKAGKWKENEIILESEFKKLKRPGYGKNYIYLNWKHQEWGGVVLEAVAQWARSGIRNEGNDLKVCRWQQLGAVDDIIWPKWGLPKHWYHWTVTLQISQMFVCFIISFMWLLSIYCEPGKTNKQTKKNRAPSALELKCQ